MCYTKQFLFQDVYACLKPRTCFTWLILEDVPLVEFVYLVFTRMLCVRVSVGDSGLCCLCGIFRALINFLVCWLSLGPGKGHRNKVQKWSIVRPKQSSKENALFKKKKKKKKRFFFLGQFTKQRAKFRNRFLRRGNKRTVSEGATMTQWRKGDQCGFAVDVVVIAAAAAAVSQALHFSIFTD